jgi:hypothetical protein
MQARNLTGVETKSAGAISVGNRLYTICVRVLKYDTVVYIICGGQVPV